MAVKSRLNREVTMVTKSERDAWAFIYRQYEEFAAALREADAEAAGELFCRALEQMRLQWDGFGENEQIILMAGFDLLDSVWKASHKTP